MRRTIAIGMWAALLAAVPAVRAQEAPAKATEAAKPPGKRLRVQFQETRLRGGSVTASRASTLALHADGDGARFFLGSQVALSVAGRDTPTTLFKNAGAEGRVKVETLPDGRYRLDAHFEESSLLGAGAAKGASAPRTENPILHVVRGESRLVLSEGETVPFASAVDPVTGEVVRVDLTVAAAPTPKTAPAAGREEQRLRARLVLVRRQGETTIARRPYSVVLQTAADETTPEEGANVFGGSMLPVLVNMEGQPTVALKDVGAGLRLKARRVADGRYRLDLSFSDGVLSAGHDLSPQVRTFESESQLFVQEGETVKVASAVDPETGELVEAELTVERVP
jgi:hypothetical protein